ncbi:type I glyceraldehyde-3-phosphate dehydrogenase [Wolbachia endosymbiont of Dirofilaria (Dirofilaria) immitis]|uniref:type I glyceraldehyde-3-phosphate dehydrogenase n=1 Tax=Wolbachia endosymbiont of Dirofilaria (Dirofilaria) immitis TaxID=1812115 RepID=UPI001588526E|nr:type I glyceraldehyde-3-phosphate dehydrogenase [Wolbachia endosymbiont of Dirofilaria (Dirofilaria) immitis]QKX02279.1 type I glyceraldehyde-3-phosphate dehydrogenase [Wolbachia endosymbiont of Dirofilaria (Dirofilaria) immitis]
MKICVGINGLGRIGRSVLRAIFEIEKYGEQIEVVAINGSLSAKQHVHLIKYDSIHGKFDGNVDFSESENWISINGKKFFLYRERNPENIPWNVDVVLECTGAFNKRIEAVKHNAGRVIVSAPVSDADVTIVYGVNNSMLKREHKVISAGSCTTNCLAPIVQVLHSNLGIKSGFMTTIHAYTNDQNILDGNHKDLQRARACGLSIVPTTTGAAKTISSVIPELKGKLDGIAIRVPVSNVSMIDFKFITGKKVTAEEINRILKDSANYVLSMCEEPLVSIDFVHSPYSAIVDLAGTYVTGDICRVAAWYDNEWAFSLRMLDIVLLCYNGA